MPKFETAPIDEIKSGTRMSEKKRKILEEYSGYVNQLSDTMGGKLICGPDENVISVRNYLKVAADIAGKNIKIRRSGNVISFYAEKKRGRGKAKKKA